MYYTIPFIGNEQMSIYRILYPSLHLNLYFFIRLCFKLENYLYKSE